MKRSGSSLNEGIQRKIAPSPSFRIPVDKYALMYLDNDDNVVVTGSPSVQEQSSAIFTDEMRQIFLKIVKPMVDLRIGDAPKVLAFYESALDDILQVHCCMIIRAFINLIEPKKPARYPYSGNRKNKSTNAIPGDPESTKPPWWPSDIAHKVTDRLATADRNKLILHIIRKTPFKGINADKLIEVVHVTKRSKPDLSIETICEILRVRKMEENFENGYLNKQEVIRVTNRERKVKSNDEEDSRHYYEQILLELHTIDKRIGDILLQEYTKIKEPRKIFKYPYERQESVNLTPPWWPPTIRHVRPRDLTQCERIMFLIHILCDLHSYPRVTTHRLREADKTIRETIRAEICETAMPLLDKIYQFREKKENLPNYPNLVSASPTSPSDTVNDLPSEESRGSGSSLSHNTKKASGTIDAHSDPGLRSSISQGDVHFSIPPTGLEYPFHSQNRFVHGDLPLDPQHYCQPYFVSSQPFIPDSNEALQNFPSQMNPATALPSRDQYGRRINSY